MTIVDTRPVEAFADGHIKGTINIPLGKSFITWAGWLLPYDAPFALIVDEANIDSTMLDLRLIGLDEIKGYWTPDVVSGWDGDLLTTEQVTAEAAAKLAEQGEAIILDVRGSNEYKEGHVPGALHIPLGYLEDRIDEVPSDKPVVVHCLSGFRSSIATSILHANDRTGTLNLIGGWQAWAAAGNPIDRGSREREAVAS